MIPFIFEGVYGYQQLKVKELTSGSLLTAYMVLFQYNFQNKLKYIRDKRFTPIIPNKNFSKNTNTNTDTLTNINTNIM